MTLLDLLGVFNYGLVLIYGLMLSVSFPEAGKTPGRNG